MNEKIQRELQERIEFFAKSFASDVTGILQRAVADSVAAVLSSSPSAPLKRKPGRPPKNALPPAGRVSTEALLREVAREPEQRMEQLSKRLGAPTSALSAAMHELIRTKKVKTSGQARGTKYRPA